MILSAEALALRRARQAQRRAQNASLQLSQEQKELVQTLLGAHTRHVGPMFDQLVQFKVRTYEIWPGCLRRWSEGEGYVSCPNKVGLQNPRVGRFLGKQNQTRSKTNKTISDKAGVRRPKGQPRLRPVTHARTLQPPAYLFIHHRSFPPLTPPLPLLTHFADINTFMVQQIIKFTKELPLFR